MNHRLLTLLLALLLLLTATGCSTAGMERKLDRAGDKLENGLDAVEDTIENAARRAVTPESTTAATVPKNAITKEEAEQIALNHTGFTADQTQRMHTEFEIDNGVPQYDVEYLVGDWEYEFEIHAETGQILSFDKDHRYD